MRGFSAPLAVGASLPLDVNVDLAGSAPPPMRMVSANAGVIDVTGTSARGVAPGVAALLILSESEAVALDFVHVWVDVPDRVVLHMVTPEGFDFGEVTETIELLSGDELLLSAHLFAGTQRLLGGAGTTWTVEGDAVTLLQDGVPWRSRLVARQPGVAKVRLETLGLAADVNVEVLP